MKPRALDRKLGRDLWRMRWQVLGIALLIACGVSVAVMAFSAQRALEQAGGSSAVSRRGECSTVASELGTGSPSGPFLQQGASLVPRDGRYRKISPSARGGAYPEWGG